MREHVFSQRTCALVNCVHVQPYFKQAPVERGQDGNVRDPPNQMKSIKTVRKDLNKQRRVFSNFWFFFQSKKVTGLIVNQFNEMVFNSFLEHLYVYIHYVVWKCLNEIGSKTFTICKSFYFNFSPSSGSLVPGCTLYCLSTWNPGWNCHDPITTYPWLTTNC